LRTPFRRPVLSSDLDEPDYAAELDILSSNPFCLQDKLYGLLRQRNRVTRTATRAGFSFIAGRSAALPQRFTLDVGTSFQRAMRKSRRVSGAFEKGASTPPLIRSVQFSRI
jgi:hypothetical protein